MAGRREPPPPLCISSHWNHHLSTFPLALPPSSRLHSEQRGHKQRGRAPSCHRCCISKYRSQLSENHFNTSLDNYKQMLKVILGGKWSDVMKQACSYRGKEAENNIREGRKCLEIKHWSREGFPCRPWACVSLAGPDLISQRYGQHA